MIKGRQAARPDDVGNQCQAMPKDGGNYHGVFQRITKC